MSTTTPKMKIGIDGWLSMGLGVPALIADCRGHRDAWAWLTVAQLVALIAYGTRSMRWARRALNSK